jgi:hypothetical protein
MPLQCIVNQRSAAARLGVIGVATYTYNTQFIFLLFTGAFVFHPAEGKQYSHSGGIFQKASSPAGVSTHSYGLCYKLNQYYLQVFLCAGTKKIK